MAEAHSIGAKRCTWCGTAVHHDDGYRAAEQPGARHAVFCRLEHVIPWTIKGAHWEAGDPDEPPAPPEPGSRCAHCDEPIGDVYVNLVRHRGEHRIPDAFCSVDHMNAWAKAGGRWR
jgi:hypothetical protein